MPSPLAHALRVLPRRVQLAAVVATRAAVHASVWTLLTAVATSAWPLAAQPPAPAPAASLTTHPRIREAAALLDKWLDAQRAFHQIPSLTGAVVHDQTVIWQGASGWADRERRIAATPTTLYSICSISKLFTSLSVLQLRDQGRLRLDDPVEKHLPWFNIRRAHPTSGHITVEGLLTHASGLPREAAFAYWSGPNFEFPTRQQIIEALASEETLYPAETFFQYSNLGLTMAGEIVAAASGTPYADYVRANILGPLGLGDTHPEIPVHERGKRMATGYGALTRDGTRQPLPLFSTRGIAPAAGYASSAADLARFASWHFRLLAAGGREVLDANTLREMQRVHFVDPSWETTWGLGYAVSRGADNKTFVGHGGSCPGYQTNFQMQPDEKLALIGLSNAIDVNSGALTRAMYDIAAPAVKAAVADSARAIKPLDRSLERYLGTYESVWGGEREIIAWEGNIAAVSLPSEAPVRGLTKLRKVGDHTFRRVRPDGKLAEAWTFAVGADGRVTQLTVNYQVAAKIR